MTYFTRKIIKASAGTGKTYRLSLEFIILLLKYRESINFEEILVITFTRKATAEIRERIFNQLSAIVNNTDKGKELIVNIKDIDKNISIGEKELQYLQSVYQQMLTGKDKLNVCTIDSFTNTIFRGLIAPYYNITDYEIDADINENYLPELFDSILTKEYLPLFEGIFHETKHRNLKQYENFIKDILRFRWIFHFFRSTLQFDKDKLIEAQDQFYNNYCNVIHSVLIEFQSFLTNTNPSIEWQKYLKRSYFDLVGNIEDLQIDNFANYFSNIFTLENSIEKNYSIFLKEFCFWNKNKILGRRDNPELSEKLLTKLEEASELLSRYLFFKKIIPEQEMIFSLTNILLKKYDEIKFRDKIFTYDDISYYTYRYLYDPELSIIDNRNVLNLFYEQLSYRIRFILIDEFQDTSVLQWNILSPMIMEALSGDGQKPYGGIIIVGDEKQSIYSWRGGERDLLLKVSDFIELNKKPESLKISYRSKRKLIDFTNSLFNSKYLHEKLKTQDITWNYIPVNCLEKNDSGYVEIHLRNRGKNKDSQPDNISRRQVYEEIVRDIISPLIYKMKIDPATTAILARKNAELNEFAIILDEYGIDYILESSGSLFSHRAVKSILFLLKFYVYNDIYELMKFLRSDVVLIHPSQLKEILWEYKDSDCLNNFFQKNQNYAVMEKIASILDKIHELSLIEFIKNIIEEFQFIEIFTTDIDIKNIHGFLEVIVEFQKSNNEYTSDLAGFIQYCRAVENNEEYTQLGLSDTDVIKLMTIHKSKGLEFETVFCIFDITGKHGNFTQGLNTYVRFNTFYNDIEDFAVTFNFNKILQRGIKKALYDEHYKKEAIEELNNFYVALTRARSNLFIFTHIKSTKSIDNFIIDSEKKEKISIQNLIFNTTYKLMHEQFIEISKSHFKVQIGKFKTDITSKKAIEENLSDINNISKYFSILSKNMLSTFEIDKTIDYKKIYMENKNILKGNIVHEYLSYIKKDSPNSRNLARNKTFMKFGTLLTKPEMNLIFEKINIFLDKNHYYFKSNTWNKIYNEYTIFDKNGVEFRIDRLMIDNSNKQLLIVDYKTGEHFDEKQLENYKRIIMELPIVIRENYNIETKFIEVKI